METTIIKVASFRAFAQDHEKHFFNMSDLDVEAAILDLCNTAVIYSITEYQGKRIEERVFNEPFVPSE